MGFGIGNDGLGIGFAEASMQPIEQTMEVATVFRIEPDLAMTARN